ncbi:MAG: hypothetical protein AMJ60_07575 [Desulfobacterales bacterium SG8_35]|nr:MAG: hypothetical protein AMJ60_07575 [Desulfobacterales bacterium SG8_35]
MQKSKTLLLIAAVIVCAVSLPYSVDAGSFDGSQNLLCAPQLVIECTPGGSCEQAMAANVNLPSFFQIDFSVKELAGVTESENKRTSKIKTMEFLDGKLFLQGADDGIENVRDGLAWSIAITQDTGRLVFSASGENEAFIIFGACTPR